VSGKHYDYVIVGAGSAGCTLACRLSEDAGATVLVLEAGGWDTNPWIHIPLGWPRILLKRMNDWMYFSQPEPEIGGRPIECARGRVVGGSSSINAMAYVRGHRGDYDRWAANGLETWSYAHVLPYFRRQETWENGPDPYRGGDGPLTVRFSRYNDPLAETFMAAGLCAGHAYTPDYNGAEQEGFGEWQATIRNGRRCSAAVAYLRPALKRRNVTLVVNALTTRVLFEGHRASGVEYVHGGQTTSVAAAREVILCGGVINSPQLLNLSGIGDSDDLRAQGIAVRAPLRGVGRNLQDHISAGVTYLRKSPGPLHRAMRFDRITRELGNAYLRGQGIATDLPSGSMAFLKSTPDEKLPDIQLIPIAAPMTAAPYIEPFLRSYDDAFAIRAAVLRPESRGHVRLKSADPAAVPVIVQNFLATQKDRQALRAGIRIARDVGRQGPLRRFIARELAPAGYADAELDAHIHATGISVHHPMGTCRMGPASDPAAVVDPELRVIGVEGLRVVDASVMPDLVGGNINAPVIMIAEKAADLIAGRTLLPPAAV
jgi:choline dehydrogenase/4-pyridoxate dehydrogenase